MFVSQGFKSLEFPLVKSEHQSIPKKLIWSPNNSIFVTPDSKDHDHELPPSLGICR